MRFDTVSGEGTAGQLETQVDRGRAGLALSEALEVQITSATLSVQAGGSVSGVSSNLGGISTGCLTPATGSTKFNNISFLSIYAPLGASCEPVGACVLEGQEVATPGPPRNRDIYP